MQPLLQRVEVETARRGDDDLSINDAAIGQSGQQRVVQFGKVDANASPELGLNPNGSTNSPIRFTSRSAVRTIFMAASVAWGLAPG